MQVFGTSDFRVAGFEFHVNTSPVSCQVADNPL
jgi:hypothetical protein